MEKLEKVSEQVVEITKRQTNTEDMRTEMRIRQKETTSLLPYLIPTTESVENEEVQETTREISYKPSTQRQNDSFVR